MIFKTFLITIYKIRWQESWIKTVKLPQASGLVTVLRSHFILQKLLDCFICFIQPEDKPNWDFRILYINKSDEFHLFCCSVLFLIHLDFFFLWNSRKRMFHIVFWFKIFEVFYLLVLLFYYFLYFLETFKYERK